MTWLLADCVQGATGDCHDTVDLASVLWLATPIVVLVGLIVWLLLKSETSIQFSPRPKNRGQR